MRITVSKIEAARMLRVSIKEIKEMIKRGSLEAENDRVVLSSIESLKAEREKQKRPTLAGRVMNFLRGVR